jgi:hypothetical protein
LSSNPSERLSLKRRERKEEGRGKRPKGKGERRRLASFTPFGGLKKQQTLHSNRNTRQAEGTIKEKKKKGGGRLGLVKEAEETSGYSKPPHIGMVLDG